jgi:transcriptional regulator GlxA family with amidase domain
VNAASGDDDGRKCWIFVLADEIGVREDWDMAQRPSPRQVVMALFAGVQSLDVTGPLEVFAGAERLLQTVGEGRRGYQLRTLSADGEPLRTSSGLTIVPDGRLDEVPARLDTLIVPGGAGTTAACADERLLAWVAATSARSRRTASVCTGAFVLAGAGLLDGRRATTHWASAAAFARLHPKVHVDADPIYVRWRSWRTISIARRR